MPTRKETLWFIALALLLSWGVGAWWLQDERRFILIRLLMCIPALVAMGCAWVFRREAPRVAGFAFTGWRPWLLALVYPWVMILFCLGWRTDGASSPVEPTSSSCSPWPNSGSGSRRT